MNLFQKKFYGWSRYNKSISSFYNARNIDDVIKLIDLSIKKKKTIAIRSGGYSYGDNTLNQNNIILKISQNKKILSFDKKKGYIETSGCCSIKEINKVINPSNWFLPVSPAHDGVTVSGAISNNVHGKNCFQKGYFGDHVAEIYFLSSEKKIIKCNKYLNNDLFYGLIGSLGFLGVILKVKIKLYKRLSDNYIHQIIRVNNLNHLIKIFKNKTQTSDFIISAIDLTRFNKGDSFLYFSKNVKKKKKKILNLPKKLFFLILNFIILINRFKIFSTFIEYIFHLGVIVASHKSKSLKSYEDVNYLNQGFLPYYNYIFRRGFLEYQILFDEKYFEKGISDIKKLFKNYNYSSYMSSIKYYRRANKKYSFPLNIKGFCLTIDVMADNNQEKFKKFKKDILKLILINKAQLYFGKNFEVDKKTFEKMYPNFNKIIKLKKKYDPKNIFWSDLTKRLFTFINAHHLINFE